MIDLILIGHGHFASGMQSALQLLAGDCENFIGIDFLEGTSFEDLCERLNATIEELKADKVIVLTDMPGGSPYKASALATYHYQHVRAVTGINFSLLMEIILSKESTDDIDEFLDRAIENAREALGKVILEL